MWARSSDALPQSRDRLVIYVEESGLLTNRCILKAHSLHVFAQSAVSSAQTEDGGLSVSSV